MYEHHELNKLWVYEAHGIDQFHGVIEYLIPQESALLHSPILLGLNLFFNSVSEYAYV